MTLKLPKCIRRLRGKKGTVSGKVNSVATDKQKDENGGCFGKRYLVAFMGFLFCTFINIHRLVVGVGIVAMVKHAPPVENHNNSAVYCPMRWENKNLTKQTSPLQGELDWSPDLQGYVLAAGFLGYGAALIPGGRLAEIWGAKKALLAGNILCAIFTIVSPFASWWNVYAMIVIQVLRGISQGPILPGVFIMMANWFPRSERGFLSTLAVCGFAFGAVIGGVMTGWICDLPSLGWPWAFYIVGIFSVVFTIIFALLFYEIPKDHPNITEKELKHITDDQETDVSEKRPPVPWKKIFTSVPVYALFVGLFGQYWAVSYFFSVHPTYMGTILHFPMTQNGALSCLPISMKSVGGVGASIATKRITKHDYIGVDKLRKTCNSIGAFGYSLSLLGIFVAGCDTLINIVCFSLSLLCSGVALSGTMIAAGDMSPTFAGSLISVVSTVANFASVIIPVVVGKMTQNETLTEWHYVFLLSSTLVFISGVVFLIFGSADVQPWNYPDGQDPAKCSSGDSERKKEEIYL